MRAATSALPFVLVISAVACNAITGIGDLERGTAVATQAPDGSAPCDGADLTSDANNCGTCGHACGTGNFCSSSSCVQGCTGGLLYVSPTGVDTSDGCAQTAPLKTISHAVSIAKAQGFALVQEIHVCKGVYAEPQITLDFKSSLRGSYDCTSWKRTATFGYPTFDPTNLTEIDSSPTSGNNVITLAVGGSALDAASIVDGFSIKGSAKVATSIALALNGGEPSIQNDQIIGGGFSKTTTDQASVGIQISGGASPEITTSSINGGGGATGTTTSTAIASVGISIGADSGSPNIHDDLVNGGSGTGNQGTGSVGIAVNGGTFPAATAIRACTINGGTGKINAAGVASLAVISVAPGNVELDDNVILGGDGSCASATGACSKFGIVASAGNLILRADKIYGGGASGQSEGGSAGVTVSGLKSFVAENNMIHGGNAESATAHGMARGIELSGTASPVIRNNTIYSGNGGNMAPASAVTVDPQVSAITFDNNLIAQSLSPLATSITLACSANLVKSIQNNAFLDPNPVLSYGGNGVGTGGCTGKTTQSFTTVADAQTFLVSTATGAVVSGNVRLASSCGVEPAPTCATNASCTDPQACNAAIIAGWTAATTGEDLLESAAGWKINPVCEVSQGGLDISSSLTTDLYGTKRTDKLSIGADENDAACTN